MTTTQITIAVGTVAVVVLVVGCVKGMNALFEIYAPDNDDEKNKNKKNIFARMCEGACGIIGLIRDNTTSRDERDLSLLWRIKEWCQREREEVQRMKNVVEEARREVAESGPHTAPQAAVHKQIAWPPEKT